MQRKNNIFFILTALSAIFIIAILSFSSGRAVESSIQQKPTCSQKSKLKCEGNRKAEPAGLMLESMSRQFISISTF